jgi:magnesium-transporting ATPase (P-type)
MSKEKDLETGDPKRERISFAGGWDPSRTEGEYADLIRYISTYRDRRFSKAPSVSGAEEADATEAKKGFFTKLLGKKTSSDLYEIPEDWLSTDIKHGLSTADVETRRRKTGFNELTTEKENMLLKFIGYFRGPILYGMLLCSLPCPGSLYLCILPRLIPSSSLKSWKLLCSSLLVFEPISTLASSSVSFFSMLLSAGIRKNKLQMSSHPLKVTSP